MNNRKERLIESWNDLNWFGKLYTAITLLAYCIVSYLIGWSVALLVSMTITLPLVWTFILSEIIALTLLAFNEGWFDNLVVKLSTNLKA